MLGALAGAEEVRHVPIRVVLRSDPQTVQAPIPVLCADGTPHTRICNARQGILLNDAVRQQPKHHLTKRAVLNNARGVRIARTKCGPQRRGHNVGLNRHQHLLQRHSIAIATLR